MQGHTRCALRLLRGWSLRTGQRARTRRHDAAGAAIRARVDAGLQAIGLDYSGTVPDTLTLEDTIDAQFLRPPTAKPTRALCGGIAMVRSDGRERVSVLRGTSV